jgi:ribonuclease HII
MLATCLALAFSSRTAALSQPMVRARASLQKGRAARRSPRLRGVPATLTTLPPSTPPRRPRPGRLANTATKAFALPRRDVHDATAAAVKRLSVPTIGVDEVGRGCLAGPVVACACYLPAGVDVDGIADSKTITTEKAREAIYEQLREAPGVRYALARADAPLIDEVNILQANLACMRAAAEALFDRLASSDDGRDDVMIEVTAIGDVNNEAEEEDRLVAVVDGVDDPWRRGGRPRGLGVRTVKGGDGSVPCVSAASIIAKVHRDRLMHALHARHPQYDWAANKGYGSKAHRAAITKHGWVAGLHRESFDPVKSMINDE